MRKFFLVKGHHTIEKLVEINGKAHASTSSGTFKIRENPHSNTFLASEGNGVIGSVVKIFEMTPIDTREIYNSIPFSEITDIQLVSLKDIMDKMHLEEFSRKFYLFRYGSSISKISLRDLVRILMYMQTLERPEEFALFATSTELKKKLAEWITRTFTGSSIELGFFILLECLERDQLDAFVSEWKQKDLFDINLKGLLNFLDDSFLEKKEKMKIKAYLLKLM